MVTENVTLKINAQDKTGVAMQSMRGKFKTFSHSAEDLLKHLGSAGTLAMTGQIAPAAVEAGAAVDTAFDANPLGIIIAAASALVGFFSLAVGSANEYQKAVVGLRAGLATLGPVTRGAMRQQEEFADHIQNVTTLSRESVMGVESMGASIGHFSGTQLTQATRAAIGFATEYKINATEAMKLFSQVAQGGAISLSKYGIVLKKGATAQEKLNALMKIGNKGFGLAKAQTDTLSGAWDQFKHTMEDFMSAVGKPVMFALIGLFKGLDVVVQGAVMSFTWTFNVIKKIVVSWWSVVKAEFMEVKEFLSNLMPGWLKGFAGTAVKAFKWVGHIAGSVFGWIAKKTEDAGKAVAKFGGIGVHKSDDDAGPISPSSIGPTPLTAAQIKADKARAKSIDHIVAALKKQGAAYGKSKEQMTVWNLEQLKATKATIANVEAIEKRNAALKRTADADKAAATTVKNLEESIHTFGMNAEQKKLFDLKAMGVSPAELAKISSMDKQLEALQAHAKAVKAAAHAAAEAAKKKAEAAAKAHREALKHAEAEHKAKLKAIADQKKARDKAMTKAAKGQKQNGPISMVESHSLTGVAAVARQNAQNPQLDAARKSNVLLANVHQTIAKVVTLLTEPAVRAGLGLGGQGGLA